MTGGQVTEYRIRKMVFMKKRELVTVLLCLLLLSNMATFFITRFFLYEEERVATGPELQEESSLLMEVYHILESNYFQPLDREQMFRGAVEGMIDALDDPHTRYLSPDSLEDMLIHTTGSFSGIGVEITADEGEILILRVISDSPSEEAGLLQGDRIVEVEGESTREMSLDEAARKLRGPSGTEVEITVKRSGEPEGLQVLLTRADIEMETVFTRRLEDIFGYVQVTNFDQNTARDFKSALQELEREEIKGLIFDLRNNPGGLLDEAIELGKTIVPRGEITRLVDRDGNVLDLHLSDASPRDYPIYVLVNEFSASGAEIIAGALQDSFRAELIGQPTYGKATVQQLRFFDDGSGLRYTIARYLTPGGQDLYTQGLQPDYLVEQPEEYFLQYRSVPRDLQRGDTGDPVLLLQKMLLFLDYPLEITGVMNGETIEVLQSFQRARGLSPSGELDEITREMIRKALLEEAENADAQLQKALELLEN